MLRYLKNVQPIVWIQTVGHAIIALISVILLPFLTLHMYNEFDGNLVLTTLIIGVQPLSEILLTVTLGKWADSLGRRPIILTSLSLQFIAVAGFAFAETVWMFAVLGVLNAFGRFIYIPVSRAQIADLVHLEKQAETFAILGMAESLGSLLAPALGALFFQVSRSYLFLFAAGLLFLYLLLCIKYLPESNGEGRQRTLDTETIDFDEKRNSLLLMLMMGSALPISFFHSQMETNWPIYLEAYFVNYLMIFALLETVGRVVYLFLEVVVVNRTSKFRIEKVVVSGYILYAMAALIFGLAHHIIALVVAQILLCLASMISLNHLQGTISKLAPVNGRARYFAIFGTHWDISRSIGPFIGGWLLSQMGGGGLFLTVMTLILAGGWSQYRALLKIQL
ncbi:MFS transporter [Halobacillus shinanisalinarum]|uniref:MFS transporter n=1 Tax=Halobacillus shinanisalinarum TaxID=2932258 RepID=A0ABY4GUN6_9BACI|nr:MFS transporter [Halobacillus shinanisalinarum]UOQ91734.1 MFS transporter [Halobacillus shinanisalinarum]